MNTSLYEALLVWAGKRTFYCLF